eukprot:scaffold75140_cov19-Tisochrysis_lutea.AAC.3
MSMPRCFQSHLLTSQAGPSHTLPCCALPHSQGEIEPTPYFYQNLGEAEMVVSIFCFMRLMGYPAEKITILSTYNGQKHLIRDVVERRCAQHPLFGRPAKVSMADKDQGQQTQLCAVFFALSLTGLTSFFDSGILFQAFLSFWLAS